MKTFHVSPFAFLIRSCVLRTLAILLLLACVAPPSASAAVALTLTRAEAVTALFAPGSGVPINTNDSSVWSPYVNFGSGPGFEGMLPAGSMVDPHELGWLPFPGPGMSVATPSYFFWVDDLPPAHFQHPTRFVLVNATGPVPTEANGGILVSAQGWWPKITLPNGLVQAYFQSSDKRVSALPPGVTNPDGLVAGPGYEPAVPPPLASFLPANGLSESPVPPSKACGLLLRGDSSAEFGNDVELFERDLRTRYGVPAGRIIKANGGAAATKADLVAAITALCALQPPCDKIYVRMTSHGSIGGFCLADGSISAAMLCEQLKKLAAKGVPICLLIEGCHTASLLDPHNWDFPAGSVIITASGTNECSYGSSLKFTNAVSGCVTNSLFPHAFSVCLNDPTVNPRRTEEQAFRWVLEQMPCYTFSGDGNMYYPAGSTNAGAVNPHPQIRTVGRDPNYLNLNVRNGTGAAKTDFHMVFKGDVRGGTARAWRSNPNDQIGAPWGQGGTTITYDPATDETMVCWVDAAAPVADGGFIHFGYCRPAGGLRAARQNWTPTPVPTAPADKTPTKQQSFRYNPDQGTGIIRLVARSAESGGENLLVQGSLAVRFSPTTIPLENLTLLDPMVASLPLQFISTFVLQPDQPREFLIEVPPFSPDQQPTLILQTQSGWPLNGNQVTELAQIPLFDERPVPAPYLHFVQFSPHLVVLSWEEPTAQLQSADQVTGPWTDIPEAEGSYLVEIGRGAQQQYFRLVIPSPR